MTTLGRLGMRAPMVLLGAGWLEELKDKPPKDLRIDFTVRAHPATWNDLNGNFRSTRRPRSARRWELAAAVTKKRQAARPKDEGRALVLADSRRARRRRASATQATPTSSSTA